MSTTTTVPMLCALKEGITSSSDSILQGHLRMLDRDQLGYNKGTLLLIDPFTQEAIPCLVDRLNAGTNRKRVEIKEWNYIYDEANGYRYLEFCLDNVFTKKAELSALRSGIVNDLEVVQAAIGTQLSFYTPSLSRTHVSQPSVNVAGVVVAISPLYTPPHTEARFFVEIADGDEKSAVTLYFCGDKDIHYQLCFRIGQYYTFTDLSPVTISYGRYTRDVLQYQQNSTFQIITASIYQQLEFALEAPPPSAAAANKHHLTVTKITNERATYTGYITRIIDSVLGIYELDDSVILSVFHHFVSAQPFRVNTKVQITHFHKTCIYSDHYRSILLNDVWKLDKQHREALVACNRTRIEVLAFPRSCHIGVNDLPAPNETREALAMYMIRHRYTFAQCMRFLEIYATLVIRFELVSLTTDQFKRVVENISRFVFKATNTPVTRRHGDLGNDFFQHDKVCSAIGSKCTVDDGGYLSVYLDLYPKLDECKAYLDERKKDYHVDLAGANFAFDVSAVPVQSTPFDTSMGFYILGVIELSKDGRYVLRDSQSSVFLSIGSGKKKNVQLGDMYLIPRGQYFYEDLSRRKNLETSGLSSTYLACDSDDLLKVFSMTSSSNDADLIFQIRHNFQPDKVGYFSIGSNPEKMSTDRQYVVGQVLKKFPMITTLTKVATRLMESRMVVRLYNLGATTNDDFIKLDSSKYYDLCITSRNESLKFYYQLNVGDWYVIYGLNQRETHLRNPDSTSSYFLDLTHKIYPIVLSKEPVDDAIVLIPVLGRQRPTATKVELPRPVLTISQITDPQRPHTLTNNAEYINVRGVVILKKFDQRRGFGVYDENALESYVNCGVGTGVPHRAIQIQLREQDSLQMITISIDLTYGHYPLGLVHGATVVFRNLMRKVYRIDAVYYNAGNETLIEVESINTAQHVNRLQNNAIKATSIGWISQMLQENVDISDKAFQIYCSVSTVMVLQMKWKCSQCGFTVKNSECYAICDDANRVFYASMYVELADGTASAFANVDGERLVFRLLRLSNAQITALKNFVLLEEVDYNIRNPGSIYGVDANKMNKLCGLTIDDLLTRARAVPRICVSGVVRFSSRKRKRADFQQQDENVKAMSAIRPITISDNGGLLKSFEFIKPKISIQEIEACDPVSYAYYLLNKP